MRPVGNLRIWWDVENCFGITLLFLLLLLLLLSGNKHFRENSETHHSPGPGQLENKHGGNSHNPILALQQTKQTGMHWWGNVAVKSREARNLSCSNWSYIFNLTSELYHFLSVASTLQSKLHGNVKGVACSDDPMENYDKSGTSLGRQYSNC